MTKPALIADSDWPPHHRSMLPVLLAMLTRVLPAVVIARGHGGTSNAAKRLQVIDEADRLALDHVPELAAIPVDKRHRYARSLLTAMIEDELITFRPEGSTAAADTARECLTPRR